MKTTLVAAVCAITLFATATPSLAGAPINVCAAKDGTLRLSASSSCKSGEKLLRLTEWEPDTHNGTDAGDKEPAPDPRIATLEARLAQLESNQHPDKTEAVRVDALETKLTALSTRIEAVDARAADRAKVANMANTIEEEIHNLGVSLEAKIAAVGVNREFLTKTFDDIEVDLHALSVRIDALANRDPAAASSRAPAPPPASTAVTTNRVRAPFEVVGSSGQVILRVSDSEVSDHGRSARVVIGPGAKGNYGLRVFKGAAFIAGIGEAAEGGAGVVVVNDASGAGAISASGLRRSINVLNSENQIAASMRITDEGMPLVAVYNSERPVAFFTRSSGGDGGNVTTALNNGDGVFSAGAAQDGAGEACVNRKTQAGTQRLACLGLGLPSAGMGK